MRIKKKNDNIDNKENNNKQPQIKTLTSLSRMKKNNTIFPRHSFFVFGLVLLSSIPTAAVR